MRILAAPCPARYGPPESSKRAGAAARRAFGFYQVRAPSRSVAAGRRRRPAAGRRLAVLVGADLCSRAGRRRARIEGSGVGAGSEVAVDVVVGHFWRIRKTYLGGDRADLFLGEGVV